MKEIIDSEITKDKSINKFDEPIKTKKKEINIILNKLYIKILIVSIFLGVFTVALIARITFYAHAEDVYSPYYYKWETSSFFDKYEKYIYCEIFNKGYEAYAESEKRYEKYLQQNDLDYFTYYNDHNFRFKSGYSRIISYNPSKSDINRVYLVYLIKGIDFYFYIIFIGAFFIIILFFKKFKFKIRYKQY